MILSSFEAGDWHEGREQGRLLRACGVQPCPSRVRHGHQSSVNVSSVHSFTDVYLKRILYQRESRPDRASSDSQQVVSWHGACIHDVQPPKWVQKRRLVRPDDPDADQYHYNEPKRAITAVINAKFSLVAIGTEGSVCSSSALTKWFIDRELVFIQLEE